jgi:hypothetical protein
MCYGSRQEDLIWAEDSSKHKIAKDTKFQGFCMFRAIFAPSIVSGIDIRKKNIKGQVFSIYHDGDEAQKVLKLSCTLK